MRILLLDDGRILGGGQRFARRLAAALRDAGEGVTFATPLGSELTTEAAAAGFVVMAAGFPDPAPGAALRWPQAALALRRAIETDASDLVVANSTRCSALAALALGMLREAPPLVHVLHERESADRPTVRRALARARGLVAVGEATAERYREALGGAEVLTVRNFLGPDGFAALAPPPADPAPPDGPPRLVALGRLIPEKGYLELLDELAAAPGAWSSLRIAALAQDPAYGAAVAARIEALGLRDRARLVAPVTDLAAFLHAADALVVPSVGLEAQPTAILEGLAAGLAVIVRRPLWSADWEGLPVAPYATSAELAELLHGERDRDRDADLALVRERFGADQAVAAIRQAADRARG